jgi:hypothetical protein
MIALRGIGPAVVLALCAVGALVASPLATRRADDSFPHARHARVFPVCTSCHAGVVEPGRSMFPSPANCAACHDGVTKPPVTWQPRVGPRAGNRRFTHEAHDRAARERNPADSMVIRTCSNCHNQPGAARMEVQHAVVGNCFNCHQLKESHVDAPSEACAKCHVPLSGAPGLTRTDIARFPRPQSHSAPDFVSGGHGKLAKAGSAARQSAVAANCSTCHARNLCVTCHVNAPESPVISALAFDDRVPPYIGSVRAPASHAASGFLRAHGGQAQREANRCAVCHTRESCTTCHIGAPPRAFALLAAAGPERALGVQLVRAPPVTHTREFKEKHGAEANARPKTCETCHLRSTCLDCHRPDAGRQSRFHPQGFVSRHPSAAYAREANCSDCHNTGQFCQSCHQQAGLVAASRIGPRGYHDAYRGFSLGHGQAARQSLESCTSCHAERDCTACHSAVGSGFRFNPHGPGFNPDRLRSKNPSLCIACHGRAIPGTP